MALKEYKATVVFPTGDPYDAGKGFGPSINVKFQFDDPDAPGIDGNGQRSVYRTITDVDAIYLQSLEKGDTISLYHATTGKPGSYTLMYDEGALANKAPKQTEPQRAIIPAAKTKTWTPMSDDEVNTFLAMADTQATLFMQTMSMVMNSMPEGVKLSNDNLVDITGRVWYKTGILFTRGMTLKKAEGDNLIPSVNALIADGWTTPMAVLEQIGIRQQTSVEAIQNTLGSIGLRSEDITDDEETWLNMLKYIEEYAALRLQDIDHDKAARTVADNHNIPAF